MSTIRDSAPSSAGAGPSDRPALNTIDSSLAERFGSEVEQCVAVLSAGIVELEAEAPSSERWEELMRAAHSLKGAARVVGLLEVAKLAHALEDYFVATRAASGVARNEDVDRLLETVDLFQTAGRATARADSWAIGQAEAAALAMRESLLETEVLASRAPQTNEVEAGTFQWFSESDNETSADVIVAEAGSEEAPATSGGTTIVISTIPRSLVPTTPSAEAKASAPTAAKPAPTAVPSTLVKAPAPTAQERVLRVAADSIDRMMGLAGESLVESRRVAVLSKSLVHLKREHRVLVQALAGMSSGGTSLDDGQRRTELEAQVRVLGKRLGEFHGEFDDYMRRVEDLSERLYREALKTRMRPFSDGAHGLPRLVRDVSRKLGKQARLTIVGEATEVDRDVLESLDAPLNHLLRNALDHGIEDAEARAQANKPPVAQLLVEVRHQAGMFAVTLSDDGRGIDPERIRQKVIDKGLSPPETAQALTGTELYEFLFVPGFSTAAAVSEISGRGVGLDVVRTSVEALGGSVQIESVVGQGTTFKLLLPVTRSVLRALVTEVDREAFAFPLLRIERIERIAAAAVRTLEGHRYTMLDERPLALVSASRAFGYPDRRGDGAQLNVVVLGDRNQRFGVIVDEFRGERDLVVRPLDARLRKVEDISAAAVLADGTTALIVDVDDMARTLERLLREGGPLPPSDTGIGAESADVKRRVLIVDDSITVREAERQVLLNRGFDVEVAVDGSDGLHAARRSSFDLIVTDIDMPRMNGLDLVRALKDDPRLSKIPVIVVSYKGREEDQAAGLAAGADVYLTKSSFHDRRLLEAVERLLPGGPRC